MSRRCAPLTICDPPVCGRSRRPGALGQSRWRCLGGLRAFSALPPHTVRPWARLQASCAPLSPALTARPAAAACCLPVQHLHDYQCCSSHPCSPLPAHRVPLRRS